jgi:hypothetical protein
LTDPLMNATERSEMDEHFVSGNESNGHCDFENLLKNSSFTLRVKLIIDATL